MVPWVHRVLPVLYQRVLSNRQATARDLTKQATLWHWDALQQQVFEVLKGCMCTKLVLQQPDFSKTFYLQTDTLAYGVGAIFSQEGGTSDSPNSKPK